VRAHRRTLAPGARQTVQSNLLSVRAQRRTLAPGARQTVQSIARNQNERKVLEEQIAISQ